MSKTLHKVGTPKKAGCKLCGEKAPHNIREDLREEGWTIKALDDNHGGFYWLEICPDHSQEEIEERERKIKKHFGKLRQRRENDQELVRKNLGEFA